MENNLKKMFQKLIDFLFGKKENNSSFSYLEQSVPKPLIDNFIQQAKQKIDTEGWGKQGRNVDIKIQNFVNCWITEEGFKQILIKKSKWFRYRGLYFGDAAGAGPDFSVKLNKKEVTIGLRSISLDSLTKWKSVPYPDDRYNYEKDKIADYHIVCMQEKGKARFYGIISKEELLMELGKSKRLYSPKNQEHFRVIPLEKFRLEKLVELIEKME